jgi:catechol 2,3-dioxygenase
MTDVPTSTRAYGIAPAGHRLPDATHVGRVRLQIADLARSIEFYESVIGLRVVRRSAGVAELAAQNDDHVLVELREKPGVRPAARRGLIGLYHYAILLPDRAALGRFLQHLADLGVRAGMSDHFVSEAVYLSDPDGLGIEVYADRPRTAWRVDDKQLAMTTVPLDVQDLIAAANGQPWTGAPAGTTIGHVHLYVRDIAEAAAFYHDALGLDKVVWNYPGALFLSPGGYHHHLGTNTWAAEAPLAGEADAQLLDWELVLPTAADVRRAAGSLETHGFATTLGEREATARDPWGTALRLTSEAP